MIDFRNFIFWNLDELTLDFPKHKNLHFFCKVVQSKNALKKFLKTEKNKKSCSKQKPFEKVFQKEGKSLKIHFFKTAQLTQDGGSREVDFFYFEKYS